MPTCEINKIDSNVTGLRYAQEDCPKLLPATPIWNVLEPNSYSDFGGQITTVARSPINQSRQRKKGVTTDLDASGGFNTDLTATNLQDLMQGYLFADVRIKTQYTETAAAGDLVVTSAGSFPVLTSTILDFTTLELIPGEWIFVGGDGAGEKFTLDENNGFKRIRSVTANALTFDKSVAPMTAEAGAGLTVKIFMGKVLKNESDPSLIKRRSYQLERTLGSLDGLTPPQSEYLVGSIPNEISFNLATADKVTADLTFVSLDSEQRTQAEGLKPGTRPALAEADMFNTSSDFRRIKLSAAGGIDEAPLPLFAFLQEGTLTINNGVTPNKAIGVLGAFDASAADFVVSGTLTAYFSSIEAVQAVRNNADLTLDMIMVKGTAGMIFDMPLISLGDGRPKVTKDEPITLALTLDAATGSKIDGALDHTALFVFFDNLPALAGV